MLYKTKIIFFEYFEIAITLVRVFLKKKHFVFIEESNSEPSLLAYLQTCAFTIWALSTTIMYVLTFQEEQPSREEVPGCAARARESAETQGTLLRESDQVIS